jgi:hypothetical protein
VKNKYLDKLTADDIDAQVAKILRGLGNPSPPLKLDEVRELRRLDRQYYSSSDDGALREFVSRMKVAGKQVLSRPSLILDVVRKLDLKALWVPDRQRILIDSDQPELKWRWSETHEIIHSVVDWHRELSLGDTEMSLSPGCHAQIEAEANYGAGRLLFMQGLFDEIVRSSKPSLQLIKIGKKEFGNTLTSSLWRVVEALTIPALGIVSQHPHYTNSDFDPSNPCKYFIRSRQFEERFSSLTDLYAFQLLKQHCNWRTRGPVGEDEILIRDDRGDRHFFYFEAFAHKHDTLTLFTYIRPYASSRITLPSR